MLVYTLDIQSYTSGGERCLIDMFWGSSHDIFSGDIWMSGDTYDLKLTQCATRIMEVHLEGYVL